MEVKNYAAQVESYMNNITLKAFSPRLAGLREDLRKSVIDITNAIHFEMPDNGRILDDELHGLDGVELRLPFPTITIAYDRTVQGETGRTLVVAKELINPPEATHIAKKLEVALTDEQVWIDITVYDYFKSNGYWSPSLVHSLIPSSEWELLKTTETKSKKLRLQNMPCVWHRDLDLAGDDEQLHGAQAVTIRAARAVLDFIEALSCSNVTHEAVNSPDAAVNARRVRKGKTPINEVRTLVITAGDSATSIGIGGHRGPGVKQHLCRGHIRRHPTAGNIWINSHVRGNASLGVIEKNYDIRKAA
jgi:hypothetical protein